MAIFGVRRAVPSTSTRHACLRSESTRKLEKPSRTRRLYTGCIERGVSKNLRSYGTIVVDLVTRDVIIPAAPSLQDPEEVISVDMLGGSGQDVAVARLRPSQVSGMMHAGDHHEILRIRGMIG